MGRFFDMDVLSSLHRDGLTVTRLGLETLQVSPSARLTDQHRSLIKAHKTNILAELGRWATTAQDNLDLLGYQVEYVRDSDQAVQSVNALLNDSVPVLGLDIETGGLDPLTDTLRCIQVATANRVYVFDLKKRSQHTCSAGCLIRARASSRTMAPSNIGFYGGVVLLQSDWIAPC